MPLPKNAQIELNNGRPVDKGKNVNRFSVVAIHDQIGRDGNLS